MTTKNVTVENFIKEYLIQQIGDIKDKQPYFAFTLMAIGIEFLGKCQNNNPNWNYYAKRQPQKDFNKGMGLAPLKKYKSYNLYHKLRCGLAHSLSTNGNLSLSNKNKNKTLNSEEFYNAFAAACNEVLNGNVYMPKKKLSDTFFVVTTTDDGASITGSTPYQTNKIQN